jgi:hypothetical protein
VSVATKKITKTIAKQVLAEVERVFAPWIEAGVEGPKIVMDFDWLGYGGRPSIVWEAGPYQWTYLFPRGGIDEEFGIKVPEAQLPEGVYTEAQTGWALSIYAI